MPVAYTQKMIQRMEMISTRFILEDLCCDDLISFFAPPNYVQLPEKEILAQKKPMGRQIIDRYISLAPILDEYIEKIFSIQPSYL